MQEFKALEEHDDWDNWFILDGKRITRSIPVEVCWPDGTVEKGMACLNSHVETVSNERVNRQTLTFDVDHHGREATVELREGDMIRLADAD
jgi:hypothetical protein